MITDYFDCPGGNGGNGGPGGPGGNAAPAAPHDPPAKRTATASGAIGTIERG